MRILIENNAYAPQVSGGAELSVQGIAEELARRGHDVWVLAAGAGDQDGMVNGVRVARRRFAGLMPYAEHRAHGRSPLKMANKLLVIDNPANAPIMDSVFSRAWPDVLLSNNLLGVTPEVWRAARRAGVPIMHTVRDCALMCPNSILTCKQRPSCERPLPHCRLMRRHMRLATRLVDTACAPSRYMLDLHVRDGYFPSAHTCVIPNAVSFDEREVAVAIRLRSERDASRLGSPAQPLRVCYLGRLAEEKGVLVLLSALCDLWMEGVHAELHLAGAGPLQRPLEDYARRGIPLHLHGFLDRKGVGELLLASHVLVAPSLCAESFGRVVLDAYAHAMPAIVSDKGALPEVLQPDTGMVCPAGDDHALAEALMRYVDDASLCQSQGAAGAEALARFTVERQAASFEQALEDLLRNA